MAELAEHTIMSELTPRSTRPLSPFGLRIRRACDERGITLRELAQKAGISYPHLSKLLHGWHQAQVGTLQRIAALLEIPISDLIGTPSEVPG